MDIPVKFGFIFAGFSNFFGISKENQLFVYDIASEGFVELNVVSAGRRQACEHGVQDLPR